MVFDPNDEARWAALNDDAREAEHARLRDNYLSQLEARVCQREEAKLALAFFEAEIDRVRQLVADHNGRLPRGRRQAAPSDRSILSSDSPAVRKHRERIARAWA